MTDSYARGSVSGGSDVGGLIGLSGGTVTNSYAAAGVSGVTDVGGLGGSGGGSYNASFWDTDVSGQSTSDGGTGAATTAMTGSAAFVTAGWDIASGWDASKVWGICAGVNDGYPFLSWQASSDPCTAQQQPVQQQPVQQQPAPFVAPQPEAESEAEPVDEAEPAVVMVNGERPEMAPGEVVVLEGGVLISVEVSVVDGAEVVLEAPTFELQLSGECTSGCTVEETPAGLQVLTLEENGRAVTAGEGFQPGSRVDVWLFSTPRYLGQLTVAADGTFTGSVELEGIDVGSHTLQVNGVSLQGDQRSANLGVVVAAEPVPAQPTLPATGTAGTMMPWAILISVAGGLVVLRARRAQRFTN